MGLIIDVNDHLSVELRRESFIVHDDALVQEAPEFGYERVYGLIALLAAVEQSERFQRWLAKREGRR